jgi:hypothetical protein
MMNAKRRILIGLAALAAAGTLSAAWGLRVSEAQGGALRGVWTAQPSQWRTTDGSTAMVVQLSLRRTSPGHDSSSSFPVALADLKGLTAEQARGTKADVRFELVRDAGTVACEGRFDGGDGAGHFTFAPSAEYVQVMRKQGYDGIDEEQAFTLAMHDVSRDFIRDLASLGYTRLPLDELVSLRIHGASPAYIRELRTLGYDRVPVDDLVSLRIHGASAEFIRALKDLGYDKLDPEGLVNLRIHGASPEFIRDLRALGYGPLTADELVNMRIHGVTPEFIRRVNGGKTAAASVDQLVDLRIHGRER